MPIGREGWFLGVVALLGAGLAWGGLLAGWSWPEPPRARAAAPAGGPSTTPTAGGCSMRFQDVPPGYPGDGYIYCVACQGSMSGFPCGGPGEPCVPPDNDPYFRPTAIYSNTRGELIKIIALGAGWAEAVPSSQWTYEDVPPGSPFWIYVERATLHGVIAGYPCGGPGEPCIPPGNRPYFRLNNPVTRGQFAKIIGNAAQFSETPATQTFEDVPPSSVFYIYIEWAAGHGVLTGWPCGGPTEPCIPPGNRPYFRPNDPLNLSRVEMAQAIARAFLPACPVLSPTPTVTGTPPTSTPTSTVFASDTPTITQTPTTSATPTPFPTLPPPSPCDPAWRATPRQGSGLLGDVYATAGGDAWAAGVDGILHWDGAQWQIVGPAGGYANIELTGPNDAWGINGSTIGHWDGITWSTVSYPPPFSGTYQFAALSAWSSTDIWVVGHWDVLGDYQPEIVLHWNGTGWSVRADTPTDVSPQGGCEIRRYLERVAAVGPEEMWAYGHQEGGPFPCGPGSVVVHQCLSGPCPAGSPIYPSGGGEFTGGALVTTDDRWLVGGGLVERWDGAAWTVVPHPNLGTLGHIVATGPNDAWATAANGILHWDGTAWTVTYSGSGLRDVAAGRANDAWAAQGSTLLHWPDFPLFQDVPPAHTFYPYVDALACRGIIGGYPCGGPGEPCQPPANLPYYRPGNSVTRGQTAKIVAGAAAWTETPTTQTFEDVPPGSTFYLWVEQMASRGIIGGYPCGGAGEPCVLPGNRPYFRPNNNVTRGQIAKIVSNSAGWSETPTAQTFEDVPPGSTFYLWAERVASRGIIGGYPCGGSFEPCVPPGNRPYYRPGNNSTRGQTAKIVKQAFFPSLRAAKR